MYVEIYNMKNLLFLYLTEHFIFNVNNLCTTIYIPTYFMQQNQYLQFCSASNYAGLVFISIIQILHYVDYIKRVKTSE